MKTIKKPKQEQNFSSNTVHRPWGCYTIIEKKNLYQIKRIVISPKQRLSLQLHQYRNEHWIITKGFGKATLGNQFISLHENEHIYIPKLTKHRIANSGDYPLEFIEVQTGNYLEEDDIVRFEDDYGRIKK